LDTVDPLFAQFRYASGENSAEAIITALIISGGTEMPALTVPTT
jgi:hypothetical protein